MAPNRYRLYCSCALKDNNLTVTATTDEQSTNINVRLNLTRKQLQPPKFELMLPSELNVALNERCTFPVEFSGEEIDVKWFFNSEQLSSDFQVKTINGEIRKTTTAIITQMKQTLGRD